MSRLPQPGGDSGNWGTILNDYLSQSLKPDGTIKDAIVTKVHLDSSVQASLDKADTATQPAQLATKYTRPSDGIPLSDMKRSDLDAVYVRTVNGISVDGSGNVSTNTAASTMGGLVRALRAGQSAALSVFGDSTGFSDGTVPADDRLTTRFARRLATAYPSHHVMVKSWNSATEDFDPWVAIAPHASGRRHTIHTSRSIRYVPTVPSSAKFTSGNIDVRALIAPNTTTPSAPQTIVARTRKGGASGHFTNDLQFDFRWYTNGMLSIRHSQDGAVFLSDRISTVAAGATAGQPIWVRATVEITPGSGFVAKFYTSPASDGVSWTQIGSNVSGGGAGTTAMYASADDSFFEAGAFAWQPASNPFSGKIYEVQIRDGVNGPCIAPCAVEQWERYGDAATSYGGAPTLYVLNASRPGSVMSYHADTTRLKKETPDYGQQTLIFNDSHNEASSSGSLWIPPYEAWVTAVKNRLPNGQVNVIGQNPHTSAWVNEATYGMEHVKRIMELSAAAGRLGWGFINIYQAYLDDSRGLGALISSDGLHPTQVGYELSGDTIAKTAGM